MNWDSGEEPKNSFDDRRDRADVDEALRRDGVEILHGHALADDALEAGEADAELILQQLAHAAQRRRLPRWSISSVVPAPMTTQLR